MRRWPTAVDVDTGQRIPVAHALPRYTSAAIERRDDRWGPGIGKPCHYCGSRLLRHAITRDHVIPQSRGGKGGANIVIACAWCNGRKGSMTYGAFIGWLLTTKGREWLERHDLGPHRVLVSRYALRGARIISGD